MKTETHSFIVRIWIDEIRASSGTLWHGSIEHVGSDNRLYFTDLNSVARFIQEQIGMHRPHHFSWWKCWLLEVFRGVIYIGKARH